MGFILRQVDGRERLPFEVCLQEKGITVRTEVLKDQYLDMLGRYDHITFTVAKVKPPMDISACNLRMRVEPVFKEDGTRYLRANVYKRWWLGHIPLRDRSYVVRDVADLKKTVERVHLELLASTSREMFSKGAVYQCWTYEVVEQ